MRRDLGASPGCRGAAITDSLKRIREIEPRTKKAARVAALMTSWLEDESGYDEEAWPELKKALDEERRRQGARRLFDA